MSFAPTRNAALNLVHEGISPRRIFITGNTIVDMIVATAAKMGFRDVTGRFGFDKSGKNILMTLHRAENVDDPVRLRALAATAIGLSRHGHVIFPVHPRTVSRLEMFGLSEKLRRGSITMTEPVGYLDFLSLERMADLIVTDSGGVQEEALVLGTPAITLRDNTERPETVWSGGNYVSGTTPDFALVSRLLEMKRDSKKLNVPNALGDGNAGARIAEITLAKLEGGFALTSPDYRQSGSAVHRIIRVGAPFKVSDLEAQAAGLEVLVVYDYLGRPNLPYPERVLGSGDAIAVMGGEQCIEKATAMLKGARVEEKVFT
jgi:UDP-N-acetylglucosamine 2-epimerase (non-hydrolysing)